jgi:Dak1 domain
VVRTVPAAGEPNFRLAEDEIEWGLGIHGEVGVERGPARTANAIVERLLHPAIVDLGLTSGDSVALLVNNLGGTSVSELGIVAGRQCASSSPRPRRRPPGCADGDDRLAVGSRAEHLAAAGRRPGPDGEVRSPRVRVSTTCRNRLQMSS